MHLISAVDSAALAPVRKLRTLPRAPSQRLRRERDEGRGRESGLRVENERLRRLAHDARREADIRAVPLPADRERSRPPSPPRTETRRGSSLDFEFSGLASLRRGGWKLFTNSAGKGRAVPPAFAATASRSSSSERRSCAASGSARLRPAHEKMEIRFQI